MSQEKAADELGFKILSESPYNVGGAAGSMAVLRNKVGEHYREGLSQVVAPNNHPKLSDRVNNNISRMYTYSGNHVNVSNGTVYVNGDNIYTPAGVAATQAKSVLITWLVNWHDCIITIK